MTNPQAKLGFMLIAMGGIENLCNFYVPDQSDTISNRMLTLEVEWREHPSVGGTEREREIRQQVRDFILYGGTLGDISPEDLPEFTIFLSAALSDACGTLGRDPYADAAQMIIGNITVRGNNDEKN